MQLSGLMRPKILADLPTLRTSEYVVAMLRSYKAIARFKFCIGRC